MSTLELAKVRGPHTAATAMGLGLLLTVTTLIALVIDQARVHSIADHVAALYAPLGLHPDPNVLYGYLYVTGAAGVLLWLTMIWAVSRRKPWARVVSVLIFVVATGMGLLVLTASEYGTPIFPTAWGVLALLPCVAGLVGVLALPSRRRAARVNGALRS